MSINRHSSRLSRHECDLDAFRQVVERSISLSDCPLASRIVAGVPVYDAAGLAQGPTGDDEHRAALRDELAAALVDGPGIVVLEGALPLAVVDRASQVFWGLIEQQRTAGDLAGDHFAKPGSNDRLWNALEKLALADPDVFIDYHRSDAVAVVCEAWLGPRYQVTEQVNVVNPGGEAQQPHRDYHMGFLTDDEAEQYPRHAHLLSPLLTLQGAVAHCDMDMETGPTMYLPHSHKYDLGYLAWRRPEFMGYFAEHRVQLPLCTGDAVFFSPAMFHAAGHNRTADVRRIDNLLQISSAFGRATESVDRARMVRAVYPSLRSRLASGLNPAAAANVVAACAEGYAFPTNLDRDQPVDGLAPPSQADLMNRALDEDWSPERLHEALRLQHQRRLSASAAHDPAAAHAARDGSGQGSGLSVRDGSGQGSGLSVRDGSGQGSGLSVRDGSGQGSGLSARDGSGQGSGLPDPGRGRVTVEAMLGEARASIDRFTPVELAALLEAGTGTGSGSDPEVLVIDIRDRDDRERTGMIVGSVSIPLIVLEWRCDPSSQDRHAAVTSFDQRLVTACNEGYTSSLAAASLRRLGFTAATDLEGGVQAWVQAGLPVTRALESPQR